MIRIIGKMVMEDHTFINVCENCKSILEYDNKDIYIIELPLEGAKRLHDVEHLDCPQCGEKINLQESKYLDGY